MDNAFYFKNIRHTVNHQSKFLIVSSTGIYSKNIQSTFKNVLNYAQIYEEQQKVIAKSFDKYQISTTLYKFESSQQENLSQILFPDKSKNLNKFPLRSIVGIPEISSGAINIHFFNKWPSFVDIIVEKLNATLIYEAKKSSEENAVKAINDTQKYAEKLYEQGLLDFLINNIGNQQTIQCYDDIEICLLVPLPPKYSIYELILILPLDKSCWMWLGITVVVSAIVWRIFEGTGAHWNFTFGIFAYFVGQSLKIPS